MSSVFATRIGAISMGRMGRGEEWNYFSKPSNL